jgi:MOSC domain-containing protein YiiM
LTSDGVVLAVSRNSEHRFSKSNQDSIKLVAGLGVEGDAHIGVTVQHRSRVARDQSQPNLRQVHLIHAELFNELHGMGFVISPGQLGENITTRGLGLLALPKGARLHIGATTVVEVTGLRNPCVQLDAFRPGLMKAVLGRDENGKLVRKAGIMGIVLVDGDVKPGDPIDATLPPQPHRPLDPV